jgi:hypothetical protein
VQPQHRAHLLSTRSTIQEHLAAIRKVATTGDSPGGARSEPLPAGQRDELLAVLGRVEASLTALLQGLAPEAAESEGARDAGGARLWTAILLRTVAELVADLDPEVMERRYGPADPATAAVLREAVPRLCRDLDRALRIVG